MLDESTKRYTLVGFGSIAYAALMFVWFSLPAYLTTITAEFGLSNTQAGLLTGAVPLTYVPVALFSGVIIDRIGPYRAIGVGLLLFGGAQLGRAGADSFVALLALTALVGVGGTTITFGLPKLVSNLFPTAASGSPSSIYMLGSFVGTAAAFSLGRGVVGPAVGGWRPLFQLSGALVVCYAIVWWIAARRLRSAAANPQAAVSTSDGRSAIGAFRHNVSRVFDSPSMRLLVVIGTVYLLVVHGFQNWLAVILETRGLAPTLAATITSGFVLAEAAGTVTAPALSDRLGVRGGVIAACGAGCALGVAVVLLPGSPIALAVSGALVVGVGVGGLSPLVRMVPAELEGVGPALTGTAIGLVFAVGELGGFLGPFLIGFLYDVTGSYTAGLGVICVACLAVVVAGRRLAV